MLARAIALAVASLGQSVDGDSIVEMGDWLSWASPAAAIALRSPARSSAAWDGIVVSPDHTTLAVGGNGGFTFISYVTQSPAVVVRLP